MTHEPLYERILHEAEQDAHRSGVWARAHLPHHAGRHATSTPAPPSATIGTTARNQNPGGTMSLKTIETEFDDFVQNFPERVKSFALGEVAKVAPRVTELADIGDGIVQDKVVQKALQVTLGDADADFVINLMDRLDTAAHNAETAVDGTPAPVGVPVADEPVSDEPAAPPVVVAASAEQSAPSPVGS